MDITNFFKLSEGNWLCQKTFYDLSEQKYKSLKDELSIKKENMNMNDLKLISFDQQNHISYSCKWKQSQNKQSNIIINTKKNYIYTYNNKSISSIKEYKIENNKLTICSKRNNLFITETILFLNPNLRLATIIVKNKFESLFISFSSEIKLNNKN